MEDKAKTHMGFWVAEDDRSLVDRVDMLARYFSAKDGFPISRSAMLRVLVTRGLEQFEKEGLK